MITKKEIKEIAKENKKKISKEAYAKLDKILYIKIKKYLEDASFNANLEGRKIIKAKDIRD